MTFRLPVLGTALALAFFAPLARAAEPRPLSIVYGPRAATREGDFDYREQIFISVPVATAERLYLRVFDPEVGGAHDTPYGRAGDSVTVFRLSGGPGAWTKAARPVPVEDGDGPTVPDPASVPDAGRVLFEQGFSAEPASDGRWVTLAPFSVADGEIEAGRAWLRLDVIGESGDDGNAFAVEVSLSPDRSDPPADVRLFAFQPTLRWPGGADRTEVRFVGLPGEALTFQNFDAAQAEIRLVSTFGEMPFGASAQDVWAVGRFTVPEGMTAIDVKGGTETPNDVTLAIFSADGAPVPFELPVLAVPPARRPAAAPVATPLADCRSVAFDATRSKGVEPLRFVWNFGDGDEASEATPVHRYRSPGRYEARLQVAESSDRVASGVLVTVPVHVRNPPVANPGEAIVVAPGAEVRFDGADSVPSDSPIVRWLWDFGDARTATGVTAAHVYAGPGLYRAVLRVEDGVRHPCNFGIAQRLVRVNFPPIAEAGDQPPAAVGQTLRLNGGASYDVDGRIAAARWDFGDGTAAVGLAVDHVYREPGVYRASLTVTDDSGVANSTSGDVVTIVVNAPPVAAATGPARPIAVGEVGLFDAGGSYDADGAILSYFWEFGDGSTGEGRAVEYAYALPGRYDVRLTVRDNSGTGSDTAYTLVSVEVSDRPVADAGPDRVVTASEVLFDGGGSFDRDGHIVAWDWDFGDGTFGAGREVRHAYAATGTYTVKLTVRDNSGSPLNVDEERIAVRVNAVPIADAGPDVIEVPGREIVLDGSASLDPDGTVASWTWEVSDGRVLEGRRIALSFAEPGLYRVGLTVRDDTQQDAAWGADELFVRINAAPVAVAGTDVSAVPGQAVALSAANSFDPDGRIASYRWDFSDLAEPVMGPAPVRTFGVPGTFRAQLTVIDDSGALNSATTDELVIAVNGPPVAEAGAPVVTDSLYVTLDASGSSDPEGDRLNYVWDFGDGSAPRAGRVVAHVYPRSGRFPVTLTVDDGSGLPNAVARDTTSVTINGRPVAVAGENREICSGDTVLFDASASRDPDSELLRYLWDFGDGTRSELVNPSKTYERPGVFPVTLTVRDTSGALTGTDADRVAVVVREAPIAEAGPPVRVCTNQEIRFDGSDSRDVDGTVNAFFWNFGDGNFGAGEKPVHVYERPGEYRAVLTITGDPVATCKATDTDEALVTVVEAPRIAIAGPARTASGVPAEWRAELTGDVEGDVAFSWTFGDGAVAEGPAASHSFAKEGSYLVTLTADLGAGQDSCGTILARLRVTANAPPQATIEGPAIVSAGDEAVYDASASSDGDGAITRFDWDFGDGTRATGVRVVHRYESQGDYALRLTVTDDAGVANSASTAALTVRVEAAPATAFAPPGALCPGETWRWAVPAGPADAVAWQFGDGTAAEGPEAVHAFAVPGRYGVEVAVDDGKGLPASLATRHAWVFVNMTPVAEAGPDRTICPGDTLRFDAGASRDSDGTIADWLWSFGDGTELAGREVSRVFAVPGPLAVRLAVTDDSGSLCATGADEARVLVNAPPAIDAGPPREGPVGAAHDIFVFDAAGAVDPDGHAIVFTWDMGDGTRLTGERVVHRYAKPGEYTVRLEAQDETGLPCGRAVATTRVRAVARP